MTHSLEDLRKGYCYQSLEQGGSGQFVLKAYRVSFGEGDGCPI